MDNNILNAGAAELTTLKQKVAKLEFEKRHNDDLIKLSAYLQKEADKKKKAMNDEIETTLSKRKDEIEKRFDDQIASFNKDIKRIRSERQKVKDDRVSEKVVAETADLREEVKVLRQDIKKKVADEKLPFITKHWLFYALFMPKSVPEIMTAIGVFILVFMLLPVGISSALHGVPFGETMTPTVVYMVDILIFGGIYVLVNNLVKDKNRDQLRAINDMRGRIRMINDNIKAVKRGIENDADESSYNLEKYDNHIRCVEIDIRRLEAEKKGALTDYNNNICPALTEEIQGRLMPEINNLKKRNDEIQAEQRATAEYLKDEGINLAKNYEPYLGKANMNEAALDRLIEILNSRKAATVGEALAVMKEEK